MTSSTKKSNKEKDLLLYYHINQESSISSILKDFGISDIKIEYESKDASYFRSLGREGYTNFLRAVAGLIKLEIVNGYPGEDYEASNGPMLDPKFINMFNIIGAYGNDRIPLTERELNNFYIQEDENGLPAYKNLVAHTLFNLMPKDKTASGFISKLTEEFGYFENSGKVVTHILLNKKTLSNFIFDKEFHDTADLNIENLFSDTNPILGYLFGAILIHKDNIDVDTIYLESSGNNLDTIYRYPQW